MDRRKLQIKNVSFTLMHILPNQFELLNSGIAGYNDHKATRAQLNLLFRLLRIVTFFLPNSDWKVNRVCNKFLTSDAMIWHII